MSICETIMQTSDVQVLDESTVYQGFYTLKQLTLSHRLFAGGCSKPFQRELVLRPQSVLHYLIISRYNTWTAVE